MIASTAYSPKNEDNAVYEHRFFLHDVKTSSSPHCHKCQIVERSPFKILEGNPVVPENEGYAVSVVDFIGPYADAISRPCGFE